MFRGRGIRGYRGSSIALNPGYPAALFAAGEQGVWYDPSDFSTMFQDVAGTTPVTAVGQSVALIRDKSGRGNHATQSVAGSRPTVNVDASGKYFLLFDGIDDSMLTGSINFNATNKMTMFAGVRKLSDAATGMLAELSSDAASNAGSFQIRAPSGAAANYLLGIRGASFQDNIFATTYTAPVSSVLTQQADFVGTYHNIARVNGTQFLGSAGTGGGNFGNYPLYIGRRNNASLPFNGRLYSLIVRGAASTANEVASAESWTANRTGVTL